MCHPHCSSVVTWPLLLQCLPSHCQHLHMVPKGSLWPLKPALPTCARDQSIGELTLESKFDRSNTDHINVPALWPLRKEKPRCAPFIASQSSPVKLTSSYSQQVTCLMTFPLLAAFFSLARFPIPLLVLPVSLPKKLHALKSLSQDMLLRKPKQMVSNLKVYVMVGDDDAIH